MAQNTGYPFARTWSFGVNVTFDRYNNDNKEYEENICFIAGRFNVGIYKLC